jgi:hypothetical protein
MVAFSHHTTVARVGRHWIKEVTGVVADESDDEVRDV